LVLLISLFCHGRIFDVSHTRGPASCALHRVCLSPSRDHSRHPLLRQKRTPHLPGRHARSFATSSEPDLHDLVTRMFRADRSTHFPRCEVLLSDLITRTHECSLCTAPAQSGGVGFLTSAAAPIATSCSRVVTLGGPGTREPSRFHAAHDHPLALWVSHVKKGAPIRWGQHSRSRRCCEFDMRGECHRVAPAAARAGGFSPFAAEYPQCWRRAVVRVGHNERRVRAVMIFRPLTLATPAVQHALLRLAAGVEEPTRRIGQRSPVAVAPAGLCSAFL